jgi:GlpG protein
MILLLELNDLQLAQMLADYLQSQRIACQLQISETSSAIWLLDETQSTIAEQEVQRFIREPNHARYREAAWQQEKTSSWHSVTDTGLTTELMLQAQPLMLIVTVLIAGVFLLDWLSVPVESLLSFEWPWQRGQIWRLITPVLLHFSVLHLLFNLAWWWYLGGRIEQQFGAGKLTILLFSSALIPNVLQAMVSGPSFGGLSGVTYALLGYLWLRQRQLETQSQIAVSDGLFGFMLIWLVIGFTPFLGFHTANLAHLGGLIVGLLQGWRDSKKAIPNVK